MNKKYIYFGIIAILIGGLVSLAASGSPDGLEKVAQDKGFLAQALDFPISALMPDYAFPVENELLATSLAGVIGTTLVFLVLFFIGNLVGSRRKL